MTEAMTLELCTKTMDRLPGVVSVARVDPATGKTDVLYVSPNGAAIYGITETELRTNPGAMRLGTTAEERADIDGQFIAAVQTLSPVHWVGRVVHPGGEVHWVEVQMSAEREAAGTVLLYIQGLDVTARKQTEEALLASEVARRKSDALHRAVIEALPVGVCVLDTDGKFPLVNAAQQAMSGSYDESTEKLRGDEVSAHYGLFLADGVTLMRMEDSAIARALRGEEDATIEVVTRSPLIKGEVRMSSQARPIRDESGKIFAAVAVTMDITAQRALEQELVTRNEQLAASEESKTMLIERLRAAVDELSNPILEVWDDVLAMPIIGVVDSRRTADMVRRLLAEVARTQASFVIVDLTGVEIVDTKTADHLMKLMRKVEIVGARCVLTGVRPAVAETLVDIGVDFGRLATLRNLKHGLREALRHARREREGLRDMGGEDDQSGRIGSATSRAPASQR